MSHTPFLPFGNSPKPTRQGNPLYLVFVTVFLLAIAALLVLVECWRLTLGPWGIQNRAQLAAHRAEILLKTDAAKAQYEYLLRSLRHATNVLWEVLLEQQRVRVAGRDLQANEDGRIIAQDEHMARTARFLFRTEFVPLVSDTEVIEHLEAARRQEWDVLHAVGTSYIPDEAFLGAVSNNVAWAEKRRALVDDVKGLLRTLARESETKVLLTPLPPDSPTLQEAFASLDAEDAAERLKVFDEIRKQAENPPTPSRGGNRQASTAQVSTNETAVAFHENEQRGALPASRQTGTDPATKQSSHIASVSEMNPPAATNHSANINADSESTGHLFTTDIAQPGSTVQSLNVNADPIRFTSLGNLPHGWHIGSTYPRKQLVRVENGGVQMANTASRPAVLTTAILPASPAPPTPVYQPYLGIDGAYHYYTYANGSWLYWTTPSSAPIAPQPVVLATTPVRATPPPYQLVRIR